MRYVNTVSWICGNVAVHMRKVDNPECKVISLIVDLLLNFIGAAIWISWPKNCIWYCVMKRVRQFVPPATLHLIFPVLIQSHFDYCWNAVCGSCGINRADKLQKLQNNAIWVLTFANYDTVASQLFESLNWKSRTAYSVCHSESLNDFYIS